jgi:hypothetical protein
MAIYDFTDKSWHKLKTVKARAQALTVFSCPGPSLIAQALLGREESDHEWIYLERLLNPSPLYGDYISINALFVAFLLCIGEETAQELSKEIAQ